LVFDADWQFVVPQETGVDENTRDEQAQSHLPPLLDPAATPACNARQHAALQCSGRQAQARP
jgi:hypothetical protein